MATSPKLSEHPTEESIEMKDRALTPTSEATERGVSKVRYLNNLLPAIGYLDLANGLDFPANVWNRNPIPLVAKVLMGLGGSIAILSTVFAFVDLRRSGSNVKFLRRERAWLKRSRPADPQLQRLEQSWLDVNYRELGWEVVDRMLLDICMLIAGFLVGAGTLMAIRGDIPAVFNASNLLSGYIGNSFVALFAVTNMAWSIFMWNRASRNHGAFERAESSIRPEILEVFKKHTRRHQIFAIVNGPTAVVSGVGSLISATHWPGYVVLIPGIIGSVFANHYWRIKLGYSRKDYRDCSNIEDLDILARIGLIVDVRAALRAGDAKMLDSYDVVTASEKTLDSSIISFLRDYGSYQNFLQNLQANGFVRDMNCADPEHALRVMSELDHGRNPKVVAALAASIANIDKGLLRYEERFLSELYGCLCYQTQTKDSIAVPRTGSIANTEAEP